MEKKNTMLLTVIAVATLLVAVVGATFAYFSLTATNESSTTGTISTPKIGTATISSVNSSLTLTLTPEDMSKENINHIYYASTNGEGKDSSSAITIAKADLKDAQDGSTYKCEANVEVTATGGMLDALQSGWAKLSLTGTGVDGSVSEAGDIDIATLKNGQKGSYTGTATLTADTSGTGTSDILSAVLSFTNVDANQSAVAGQTLTVTIKVTGGTCTLQTGE